MIAHAGKAVLALGALGVVYGDIGTSPLYTEQVIFTTHRAAAQATPAGVYGVVSLIFWALMIVVSIKYAGFIMRAHNRGDGGIMALARAAPAPQGGPRGGAGDARHLRRGAVLRRRDHHARDLGPRLASGPEGREPRLAHLVVPLSVVILIGLFFLQRRGSGTIGWLFGPVILVWFVAIGLLGLNQVLEGPGGAPGRCRPPGGFGSWSTTASPASWRSAASCSR